MKTGVIGTGKMGAALIRGMLDSAVITPPELYVYNRSAQSTGQLKQEYPEIHVCETAKTAAEHADVIFLAVKPYSIIELVGELTQSAAGGPKLLVSVAAGISLSSMEEACGNGSRIIRVMPNTPSLIGEGALAFSPGSNATEEDCRLLEELLAPLGMVERVPEAWIDAISAISGSGPAYMYVILDALADAGVALGLPRSTALCFATRTMSGSARLAQNSSRHLMELRDDVTSPGGSTIAALPVLDEKGLRPALIEAVKAACARAKEMGKKR